MFFNVMTVIFLMNIEGYFSYCDIFLLFLLLLLFDNHATENLIGIFPSSLSRSVAWSLRD